MLSIKFLFVCFISLTIHFNCHFWLVFTFSFSHFLVPEPCYLGSSNIYITMSLQFMLWSWLVLIESSELYCLYSLGFVGFNVNSPLCLFSEVNFHSSLCQALLVIKSIVAVMGTKGLWTSIEFCELKERNYTSQVEKQAKQNKATCCLLLQSWIENTLPIKFSLGTFFVGNDLWPECCQGESLLKVWWASLFSS